MKKNEQLLLKLEQLFLERNTLSIPEISADLGIGRTSVYNYIQRLKDKGYSFEEKRVGHAISFTMEKNETTSDIYSPITADVFRKYMVVRILKEQGPCDFLELYRIIREEEDHYNISIKEIRLRELVKELLDSGELEIIRSGLTGKKKLLQPAGSRIPLTVLFDSDEDMWDLYANLNSLSPGDPYYGELSDLRDKLCLASGEVPEDNYYAENYMIYGVKNSTYSACNELMSVLRALPYKSFAIDITYKTRRNDTVTSSIETGALIYSLEKDVLYLMGRSQDGNDSIIDVANIVSAETTKIKNTVYHSAHYKRIIREMFSISSEEPVDVELRFDNVFQIAARVREMSKHSPLSKVTVTDEYITYTDTVRGLNDFRNYLRQFGRACHVIKPQSLAGKMKESAEKTYRLYQ